MTVKDLELLFDYGYWANARLFDAISPLTAEEFTRTVAGSYGSLRNTLVHVMSAEWGWVDRCGGPPRGPRLDPANYPDLESVRTSWKTVEGHVRGFLSTLTDADLARVVEFSFGQGPRHALPLGDLMQHAAVHGVHHRGQAALLLRVLGHTPGDFDVLYYHAARARAAATV
jgi:uncharacterized damage-inducible protein DinB